MAVQPKIAACIAALLLAGASSTASASDLYVACHEGVALAPADVRDVFLGEQQFLGAVRLVPVDNIAAQAAFLETVLKMNAFKYANTWAKKSFRDGASQPAVKANDAAVFEFIKRTPGGCGYFATAPAQGVTVIAKY
jgi:hypothetical protein